MKYDPAHEPNAEEWLSADESERILACGEFHEQSKLHHPELPNPTLHAMVHAIVENMLALGEPALAGATFQRLRAGGLSRHETVHAIGMACMDNLHGMLQQKKEYDEAKLVKKLRTLDVREFRGTAPDR